MSEITIFLADDHHIVREGLSLLLESSRFRVIGEASDGETAMQNILQTQPDLALIDINMPKMDGIEVTRQLKQRNEQMKVIILTVYLEEKFLVESIRAGADGYLLKTVSKAELYKGIESVMRGETYIDPGITQHALLNVIKQDSHKQLTEREIEILKLMASGHTNRDISDKLFLGSDTVKEYVSNIMKKLDCKNRTEAVAKAIRRRIIT